MRAVIMAGGEGTRLRPMTCNIPKPMVPVANIPVMQHIVELAVNHGIKELAVTLQYLPGAIKRYFGDGSDFGVSLEYFVEERPLGTAGSVRSASGFLGDTFVVISGDALTNIDISEAVEYHYTKKATVTLVLKKVEVPLEYGVVVTDADGRIRRFVEKPGWGEAFSDIANTGIYIMSSEVFRYIDRGEKLDFSKDIFPRLLEKGVPMYGYLTDRYWCDIGDMDAYMQVHRDIMDGKIDIAIRAKEIEEGIWIGKNCSIAKGTILESPCLIGDNNLIGRNSKIGRYSVLGNNNFIESGVAVGNSVIWNRCLLQSNSRTEGGIICSRAVLGKGAVVSAGSVIGEGAYIGEESWIKQGIKVWPDKKVEQGTELSFNIVTGHRPAFRYFGEHELSGKVGLDITPEFASRLGAAFASALPDEAKIAIGHEGNPSQEMIKNSLCAGMLSTGANVIEFENLTPSLFRLATCFFNCDGGIYVGRKGKGHEAVSIVFIDKRGIDIGRDMERKIDSLLSRDEFKRVTGDNIKSIKKISGYADVHCRMVVKSISSDTLDFKIAVLSDGWGTNEIISEILDEKGVSFEILSRKDMEKVSGAKWLADRVIRKGFDLGAVVNSNPAYIALIDKKGRIISGEALTALIALIIFRKNRGGTIAAPVSASGALEKIAEKHNGKVVRCKNPGRYLINLCISDNFPYREYEQMMFYFDPVSCLLKILDYLQENSVSLDTLMDSVPEIHMSRRQVDCPPDRKGMVIRGIIEENKGLRMETIEGVKIFNESGWVLVLPDGEKPLCNIISEATTQEFAEELTGVYEKKIKKFTLQTAGNQNMELE